MTKTYHGLTSPLLNNHKNLTAFSSLLIVLEHAMQGKEPPTDYQGPFEVSSMASAEMALKLSIQNEPQEYWLFLSRVCDYFLGNNRENSLENIVKDSNMTIEDAVKITVEFINALSNEFKNYNLVGASHVLHWYEFSWMGFGGCNHA